MEKDKKKKQKKKRKKDIYDISISFSFFSFFCVSYRVPCEARSAVAFDFAYTPEAGFDWIVQDHADMAAAYRRMKEEEYSTSTTLVD